MATLQRTTPDSAASRPVRRSAVATDESRGVGELLQDTVHHAGAVVRTELRLAAAEAGERVKAYSTLAAVSLVAAVFVFFALVLLVGAATVALGLVLAWWAALLVAGGACLLLALVLMAVARRSLRTD
jgi:hypothetical protein